MDILKYDTSVGKVVSRFAEKQIWNIIPFSRRSSLQFLFQDLSDYRFCVNEIELFRSQSLKTARMSVELT